MDDWTNQEVRFMNEWFTVSEPFHCLSYREVENEEREKETQEKGSVLQWVCMVKAHLLRRNTYSVSQWTVHWQQLMSILVGLFMIL